LHFALAALGRASIGIGLDDILKPRPGGHVR
jgi:hypothetical protein